MRGPSAIFFYYYYYFFFAVCLCACAYKGCHHGSRCAGVCAAVCSGAVRDGGGGGWAREGVGLATAAAFIKWEQLKLHQHKEINQRRAVINNTVIRSLVPQQPTEQMSRDCFIPCSSAACIRLAGLRKDKKKNNHPPLPTCVNKSRTTRHRRLQPPTSRSSCRRGRRDPTTVKHHFVITFPL